MMRFTAKILLLNTKRLLCLPKEVSQELPSRGMVMVQGSLNKISFESPLEPDGKLGHFMLISPELYEKANVQENHTVTVEIQPIENWPDPNLPEDIKKAFLASSLANQSWQKITSKARWDWIRWIQSTSNETTRTKRIQVAIEMLENGKKRPCCFNRNICTQTAVSKNGILIEL